MSSTVSTQYNPGPTFSATVGSASLVGKEGYGVKRHTDGTIILASTKGEKCFVLIRGAAVGEQCVYALSGRAALHVSAAQASYGLEMAVQTTGKFDAAAAGEYVVGWNTELATATGDYILCDLRGYENIA